MYYELWEQAGGNRVGVYATIEAALEVVRASANSHGKEYAATWLLASEDEQGGGDLIAAGWDLVDRALASRGGANRIPA